MPIREYKCPEGHVHEVLYVTFSADEQAACDEQHPKCFRPCPDCQKPAKRVAFSVPGYPILLGTGFYKPAASGNTSTKRGDPTQAVKDVLGAAGGAKKFAQSLKK